jgi:hypothetical protein
MRVIEQPDLPSLVTETRDVRGVGGQVHREHLDGDLAAERQILSQVDFRHPAGAQQRLELVAPELLPAQRALSIQRHPHPPSRSDGHAVRPESSVQTPER